jgi:hypothetical protein|tara:strand:+ start:298 stop:1131 length:834 start_codon:yes stop_codon:yes gene_type:complete
MTYGYDDVTFTSTAASSTAEVQLNSGTSLSAPDPAHGFLACVPYQMELGAFTVDESLLTAFRIQSDDVAVEPKKFVLPNINTGDAAFTSVAAPALLAYPINTPLAGGEHLNFYAEPLVANTNAAGVGATVIYSTDGTNGAEQYYTRPTNETAAATAINTRTLGGDMTIQGGNEITALYTVVSGATATASQHDVGYSEFISPDFNTSMPYRVAVQPTATGLGAAANAITGGGGIMKYEMPRGQGIPLANNVTITNYYTNRDARTGASNFINFVRYSKN